MFDGILSFFTSQRPHVSVRDVIDVAIVSYAIYRVLLLLRGTRAMQTGLGLALIAGVYVIAQRFRLETTYAVLQKFLASVLLVVVVLFQEDIRRALMGVGSRPGFLRWRRNDEEAALVERVLSAATLLARRRLGALIVFEREAALEPPLAEQGKVLDAEITSELLYTIFLPQFENPLHDGAVIIRNSRIWKAAAWLPLMHAPNLDNSVGTRHRAALGISEKTDAIVLVVSEERGQVSVCFNGNIFRARDIHDLRPVVYRSLFPKDRAEVLLRTYNTREVKPDSDNRPSMVSIAGADRSGRNTTLSPGASSEKRADIRRPAERKSNPPPRPSSALDSAGIVPTPVRDESHSNPPSEPAKSRTEA